MAGVGLGRDVGGAMAQGRPQPFVKIAVDDQTLDTVGEYHIWNTPYAFAYPALATDPNANIGVSGFRGPATTPAPRSATWATSSSTTWKRAM
jgi:hypothetical protein